MSKRKEQLELLNYQLEHLGEFEGWNLGLMHEGNGIRVWM